MSYYFIVFKINQQGHAPVFLLVALIGVLGFFVVTNTLDFKNGIYNKLFVKSSASASLNWPDNRFAVAGIPAPIFNQTYGAPFYYSWGSMYGSPPVQSASSPSHGFAWLVGNNGGGSNLNCNGNSSADCQIKIDSDFDKVQPKISTLLGNTVNKGGSWIVGNEVNFTGQSFMSATDHAYQFKKYRDYIKSLDPTAKLAHGSLLLIGWSGSDSRLQWETSNGGKAFMDAFLAVLGTANYPDIYNIHLYSSGTNYHGNSVRQGRDVRSYLDGKGEGSKPLWVTEGGENIPSSSQTNVNGYMDNVAKVLTTEGTIDRWFWYQGKCSTPQSTSYCDTDTTSIPITALTLDKNDGSTPTISATGIRYADMVAALNPTSTPTFIPTPTPISTPTPTPISTPTPGPAVNGLTGQYFDNKDLSILKITRIDPQINFNWGNGSPASGIANDTFSVRWMGKLLIPKKEKYKFYTTTSDGVRLWVNGKRIINKWSNQSVKEQNGSIELMAGVKYDIKIEYFENTDDASAVLKWSSPSIAKQLIPQANLFSQ